MKKKTIRPFFLWLMMLLFTALPALGQAAVQGPYWAKANGTTLYQTFDEGILRHLPSVECFQVTGSDSSWLYVTTYASGGFRQNARIR